MNEQEIFWRQANEIVAFWRKFFTWCLRLVVLTGIGFVGLVIIMLLLGYPK